MSFVSSTQSSVSEPLFPKLRNDLNIKEKIRVTVQRHTNNYFLDVELRSIQGPSFNYLHESTLPNRMVTKQELDKWLNRNQRSQNKKLAWAVNCIDEDDLGNELEDFKNNLRKNGFKSVAQASRVAASLHSVHNSNYNARKSTVATDAHGRRMVKKKKNEVEDFKSYVISKLKSNSFNKILALLRAPSKGVKALFSEETNSMNFEKECAKEELTTNNDRLAVILIEKIYNLINNEDSTD